LTLTEREKAILYLLLSDEDDRVLTERLSKTIRLTKGEWRALELDLEEFLNQDS
jgi:uncharacterized protein YdaU (DUF1376 family)